MADNNDASISHSSGGCLFYVSVRFKRHTAEKEITVAVGRLIGRARVATLAIQAAGHKRQRMSRRVGRPMVKNNQVNQSA
jgi:hypothetical protein